MVIHALAALALQSFEHGATLRVYDVGGSLEELPVLVAGQTPNIDRRIDDIAIGEGQFGLMDHFYAVITARLTIDQTALYRFRLTSDDGSRLFIGKTRVIDNDGVHPPSSAEGAIRLNSGSHELKIEFFENEGGEELKLEMALGQDRFEVVGSGDVQVPANLTRVTSPGKKSFTGIGGPKRPGAGMPLDRLHPAWKIVKIRPDDFKPQVSGMDFLPDGTLLVATFKPNQTGEFLPDLADGKVYAVTGVIGANGGIGKVREVATGLQEPLGLCVAKGANGPRVFVSQRTEVTELIDSDRNGDFEGKKTVARAWIADNYHHFTFGLAEKDGFLFAALSTSITGGAPGINGPNPPFRGCTMRIDPDNYDPNLPMNNVEFITGGHRTPNGLSKGPYGLVVVGENQGSFQPSNKINVIAPGSFFGHYNNTTFKTKEYPEGGVLGAFDHQPFTPPALYLPQNECANSPSQSVVVPSGPFKDHMLIGDVKYGGLRRAWLEKVGGVWQGGAVQYSQGFEVGTNRIVWGPDAALYVGGTGATETWAWTDPKTGQWTTYGLQKLVPTGRSAFEIGSVRATHNGFRVWFTEPLKTRPKPDDIAAHQWNYEPTVEYGGPKKNRETLKVTRVRLSAVGTNSYDLEIPGLKPDRVVYLRFNVKNAKSQPLWAEECWYTLNKIPPAMSMVPYEDVRAIVITETKGFRHDSIPAAKSVLGKLFKSVKWQAEFLNGAADLTEARLKDANVLVLLLTTGDIFKPSQEALIQAFVQRGGGIVGIHSAADTEYDWGFWNDCMAGALFKSHPAIQQARIVPERVDHLATRKLPREWLRVDEWYDFRQNPRKNVQVLARLDQSSYKGSVMGDDHPIAWCKLVGKGRVFYTGVGHTDASYREWLVQEHILGGIRWASGKN